MLTAEYRMKVAHLRNEYGIDEDRRSPTPSSRPSFQYCKDSNRYRDPKTGKYMAVTAKRYDFEHDPKPLFIFSQKGLAKKVG